MAIGCSTRTLPMRTRSGQSAAMSTTSARGTDTMGPVSLATAAWVSSARPRTLAVSGSALVSVSWSSALPRPAILIG